ncbi:MAG: METTL5 family protein [Candidatus Bathyarchaeia archaeon]
MRKRKLEILLEKVLPNPSPKLLLEQYTIPAKTAAEVLFIANKVYNDIEGKKVIDLGCGTGRLAIGAAILGAKEVFGVDIDPISIKIARKNANGLQVKINLIVGDIECIRNDFDTVLMNPPFGSWRRGVDIIFLKKAIEISKVAYSLHKRDKKSREYILKKVKEFGAKIDKVYELEMIIPCIFNFHRKKRYPVKVDLYRVLRI